MFDTDKPLIKAWLCLLLVFPQAALGDEGKPTHCFVGGSTVEYSEVCKDADAEIWASQKRDVFLIEAKKDEVASAAGHSFCGEQKFNNDALKTVYIHQSSLFSNARVLASCGFYIELNPSPVKLKQTQYRTISISPAKTVEAVLAWRNSKQPNGIAQPLKFDFIVPSNSKRKDDSSGAWFFKDFQMRTFQTQVVFELDYNTSKRDLDMNKIIGGIPKYVFAVTVEVSSPPPKLNDEGLWLGIPATRLGESGNKSTIKMKILYGDEVKILAGKGSLITKPDIYDRLFREIAESAFVESIEFEPAPIE